MAMGVLDSRIQIARRAAREIESGMIVNLGIGLPTLVADFIPSSVATVFHAENGILGYGPTPQAGREDPYLCNAGGLPVTVTPYSSFFDSSVAFGVIRRGYVDITILGALQVSEAGDLANWIIPGKRVPGMGGAIELAQKAKKVIVVMNHLAKDGTPKILEKCTLPLTAPTCVNLIVTEMAVIQVSAAGLQLVEVANGFSVQEVRDATGAPLTLVD
jgi:acetate CoA/acetoacetate CoA-transferase beta subunit